jgi:hypothetical protein
MDGSRHKKTSSERRLETLLLWFTHIGLHDGQVRDRVEISRILFFNTIL